MSEISNHGPPDLIREPLVHLLEAVIVESDEALPAFKRWCEMHVDYIMAGVFTACAPPSISDDALSFEDVLVFVRRQREVLDTIRSITGLEESGERRYQGLCAMEIDLIKRISGE